MAEYSRMPRTSWIWKREHSLLTSRNMLLGKIIVNVRTQSEYTIDYWCTMKYITYMKHSKYIKTYIWNHLKHGAFFLIWRLLLLIGILNESSFLKNVLTAPLSCDHLVSASRLQSQRRYNFHRYLALPPSSSVVVESFSIWSKTCFPDPFIYLAWFLEVCCDSFLSLSLPGDVGHKLKIKLVCIPRDLTSCLWLSLMVLVSGRAGRVRMFPWTSRK